MRDKSLGMPPGSTKFANTSPPGLTRQANAPQKPKGGGGRCWAQLELTDALASIICNVGQPKLQENVIIAIKVCLV